MTAASMLGKASLRICSFFCCVVRGRGGCVGGRSLVGSVVVPAEGAVVAEVLSTPVSGTSSSSISKGRTVVGDSGAASGEVGLSLGLLWGSMRTSSASPLRMTRGATAASASSQQREQYRLLVKYTTQGSAGGSYNEIGGRKESMPRTA